MDTMKITRTCGGWLPTVLLLCCLLGGSRALYEDQIKKFDWRSQQIGALQHAHIDLNSFEPRLLVSTHENVIASLCPKTGELVWRQVLETEPRGTLKLFQVTAVSGDASNTAAVHSGSFGSGGGSFDVLTVQGHAPALVRGWNANTANIEFEWSLLPLQAERAESAFWFYSNTWLYHVIPVWRSHLEVTQYSPNSGQVVSSTSKVTAPWITAETCQRTGPHYVCVEGNQLLTLDMTASQPQVVRRVLAAAPQTAIQVVEGADGVLVIDKSLVGVTEEVKTCGDLKSNSYAIGTYNQRRVIAYADIVHDALRIQAVDADTCEPIADLAQSVSYPEHYGPATLRAFDCKQRRKSDGKPCLFLLSTADEAIIAVQQNKIRWSREESLANVVATEFIDLPVADAEGTLENEMRGKADGLAGDESDVVTAFTRRITTQVAQLKSIFLHVLGLGPPPSDSQRAGLVRDSFGLHKMLVVLTRSGKILGIDNISGKLHWQHYLPLAENFGHGESMRLIVQRTSKHFPLQPLCTIVARDRLSGNGLLYRFNPINGRPMEGGLLRLNYKVKQLSLLAETETDFVKGILLLSADNRVEVHPESARRMANGMYLFTADKTTSTLNGLYIKLNKQDQLTSGAIWNAYLGGHNGEHKIIAVASKNPIEHVHSQGRVLGDRSVLYKYINPNLVAVVTQADDSIHKYLLNLFLIDVVSGSIIFSMTHRKARGPVHMVHSENWLAYAYYNDKVRRTEITTVELYEGKTQTNSSVWSSLNAPPMPMVERQSYIIPAVVENMRETITERGITNKHVLIGTASGAIVEMPWILLDPRRPVSSTTQGREEGAIPYIPELPLPTENIINYNQTVARLANIFTAPSGLESTCLVVATGLDMFVTRVAPSKTFDLLKEDFDYTLITIVLIALTTGSLVVKHLAARKLLKQAWK